VSDSTKKLLIVQAAGLSRELPVDGLAFRPIAGVFPALTCTAQASFRTASPASSHGMIANGLFHRSLSKCLFWEQSAKLVEGPRIWREFRQAGGTVGMMFWQQSLGEEADLILSPAPIHKHHGGMIDDCYAKPAGLYERLCKAIGRRFKLRHYWGPLASTRAGDWIAEATADLLISTAAPDLLLTYLPTLDYDLQRFGHDRPRSQEAHQALTRQLQLLVAAAAECEYEILIFGDYAIGNAGESVFPNRRLAEAGLMATRDVGGMLYPDLPASRAFAMVDHEIAHVYIPSDTDIPVVADALTGLDGVAEVVDRQSQRALGVDHPNSGELLLIAGDGRWFAYPWWAEKSQRPDYATHVDIHNKPGFDPCELIGDLLSWPPMSVSQETARIGGSHGRVGDGRNTVWAGTFVPDDMPTNLIELAAAVGRWLNT
jgi:predicted AlkP superfamily pyrophosphatase or phosphodiesterase